jgi:hypothetical protein
MTPQPVLFTVTGTGVPDGFGPGFSADVGRAFAYDPWAALAANTAGVIYSTPVYWQPCSYPAAVYPMQPSVQAGRAEVCRQIGLRPQGTPIFLSGYSQGAMVTNAVWVSDILSPNGSLHDRLTDVKGIIQFGDPNRCPGVAHGNEVAGLALPTTKDGVVTGGIAGPGDLRPSQTPPFLLSAANDGDLYAACPVGANPWSSESPAGKTETGIFNIVQAATFFDVVAVAEDLGRPVGTIEALWNGMVFASEGTNAPHWRYSPFVPAMVDWINKQI